MVNVDADTKPESKPPGVLAVVLAAKYAQGAANDDCVTEWATDLQSADAH